MNFGSFLFEHILFGLLIFCGSKIKTLSKKIGDNNLIEKVRQNNIRNGVEQYDL